MDYDAWYALYPRKQAKASGFVMWNRLTVEEQTLAMEALPKHVKMWQAQGRTKSMIPLPASWLNPREGRRWEDDLSDGVVQEVKVCCRCGHELHGYTVTKEGKMCNDCWAHRDDKPVQQLRLV